MLPNHTHAAMTASVLGCCIALASSAADTYTQAEAQRRAPSETMPASQSEQSTSQSATSQSAQISAEPMRFVKASDEIAAAVAKELQNDAVVALGDIHVRASDGIVTLTGTVETLLAKDRATHLTETVRGVMAVRNDVVVVPTVELSADDLESTIRQALVANPATEAFQVQIEAKPRGDVLLTGEVDSWAERALAERVAKSVKGVTRLENRIEVDYQRARSDTEIELEIARLLRWDAYVDEGLIDVEVEDGVVRLSGSVPSAAEKRRATALSFTAGTKSVDASALKVDPSSSSDESRSAPLSDAEMERAFRTIASMDAQVSASQVDVEVNDGIITLLGTVPTLKAKRMLLSHAASVAGVEEVQDRLVVKSRQSVKDAEIERQVIAALAADPLTEAYQISVDSEKGVVTLSGHVDSWFERGTADDLAASIAGVRGVDNDLTVERASERLVYDPYVDSWSILEYDWYTPAPPTVWKQDSEIASEIGEELAWSPFVDANEVNVSVFKGVATLTGEVDTTAERRAAVENAFEGGAVGVVNQLTIDG